jgi:hypothetical protein
MVMTMPGRGGFRLQFHLADMTFAGPLLPHLGMHGAGVQAAGGLRCNYSRLFRVMMVYVHGCGRSRRVWLHLTVISLRLLGC